MIPSPEEWRKSSYSNQTGGHCLEVAEAPAAVLIRDTRHRDAGCLTLDPTAWSAFLRAVKDRQL